MIKFGTDGWRGVVADDFTYETLRYAAQGVAEYLKARTGTPLAVVGYEELILRIVTCARERLGV